MKLIIGALTILITLGIVLLAGYMNEKYPPSYFFGQKPASAATTTENCEQYYENAVKDIKSIDKAETLNDAKIYAIAARLSLVTYKLCRYNNR